MKDLICELQSEDHTRAYALAKQIIAESAESDKYYDCLDDFIGLLTNRSAYVRTRGFCLACAQVRWDTEEKINSRIDELLSMLHNEKPAAVRRCLAALHEVATFKPELGARICMDLDKIDLSNYKESMVPLIAKDISELRKKL